MSSSLRDAGRRVGGLARFSRGRQSYRRWHRAAIPPEPVLIRRSGPLRTLAPRTLDGDCARCQEHSHDPGHIRLHGLEHIHAPGSLKTPARPLRPHLVRTVDVLDPGHIGYHVLARIIGRDGGRGRTFDRIHEDILEPGAPYPALSLDDLDAQEFDHLRALQTRSEGSPPLSYVLVRQHWSPPVARLWARPHP